MESEHEGHYTRSTCPTHGPGWTQDGEGTCSVRECESEGHLGLASNQITSDLERKIPDLLTLYYLSWKDRAAVPLSFLYGTIGAAGQGLYIHSLVSVISLWNTV